MSGFGYHVLAVIMTAPLYGSTAPVPENAVNGATPPNAAAFDPLYVSNRLPDSRIDNAGSQTARGAPDKSAAGGEGGPRGGCVDCTDTEVEANCAIPTDIVNGGCNSDPPVFANLQCGSEFCGSGATDGEVRDTDWWMFEIDQRSIVHLTVTADFLVQVGVGDLSAGCPMPALTAGVFGDACSATRVSLTLLPGTYVAFVAPQFIAPVTCGAQYTGALECIPCPCAGDFNDDGIVSLSDLALILSSFGAEPSNPCMDTDFDGVVALQDLASFLPEFGNVCP